MDHYLKFTDEAAFMAAAEAAGLVRDGRVVSGAGTEIDVVGPIRPLKGYTEDQKPQAIFDDSIEGFHVNVRGELPEAFEPFVIDAPATPFRVWAK